MENLLFEDSQMLVKQRPNFVTDQQKEAFYALNAQKIIDNGWSEDEIEDIICDLKEISLSESGYEIAKSLEIKNCYYEIDTEFIEFLDGLSYEYDQLKTQNVKEWVKGKSPQPKFKVGDKLIYKDKEVLVYGIHEETARYIINDDIKIKGGKLIPYEEIDDVAILKQ